MNKEEVINKINEMTVETFFSKLSLYNKRKSSNLSNNLTNQRQVMQTKRRAMLKTYWHDCENCHCMTERSG